MILLQFSGVAASPGLLSQAAIVMAVPDMMAAGIAAKQVVAVRYRRITSWL
jgi:hypothetical protein